MQGNFSTDSLERYQEVLRYLNDPSLEFSEEGETYDFTRCLRPDGSAYGTRGVCQAPNKVAPKQDVSAINQKDFIAGGGLTAVQKGASSTQVVNRGRDARARAFQGGGGMAAMSKGKSRAEVERSGSQARAEAYQAGGGKNRRSSIANSGLRAEDTIRQGKENRAAAYKAGGGDEAVKAGKSKADIIKEGAASLKAAYEAGGGKSKFDNTPQGFGKTDVISVGKENLRNQFEAGGGKEAQARGVSVKEIYDRGKKAIAAAYEAGGGKKAADESKDTKGVIERGKKALREARAAGGGNAKLGKDILADPMGHTRRSTLEAGGGEAMVKKVSQALTEAYRRALTDKEIERVRAKVSGKGVDALNKLFTDGGGKRALASGKTVDEVINEGEKVAEARKRKRKEEATRNVQSKVSRESQFT